MSPERQSQSQSQAHSPPQSQAPQTTEARSDLETLATLRDEIRVRMHLAGMEIKDRWRELDKEVYSLEKSASTALTEATRAALKETITRLEKFRQTLGS
jgi:hypothetical protein